MRLVHAAPERTTTLHQQEKGHTHASCRYCAADGSSRLENDDQPSASRRLRLWQDAETSDSGRIEMRQVARRTTEPPRPQVAWRRLRRNWHAGTPTQQAQAGAGRRTSWQSAAQAASAPAEEPITPERRFSTCPPSSSCPWRNARSASKNSTACVRTQRGVSPQRGTAFRPRRRHREARRRHLPALRPRRPALGQASASAWPRERQHVEPLTTSL